MQDCIVCVLRSCLEEYGIISDSDIQVQLEQSLNQTRPEDFYCRGMLEAPKVSSDSDSWVCEPGFFEAEVQCLKEFNETFTANFSDPSLCRYDGVSKLRILPSYFSRNFVALRRYLC